MSRSHGLGQALLGFGLGLLIDLRIDVALALILHLVPYPSRYSLDLSRTDFTLVGEKLLLLLVMHYGILICVSWQVHLMLLCILIR